MSYKLNTNSNYADAILYPVGSGVRVRRLKGSTPDMANSGILRTVSAPNSFGRATGRQLQPTKAKDAKGATNHGWMEVMDEKGGTGWVRFDLLTRAVPTAAIPKGDGEKLVKAFINRDLRTSKTLAYTAALLTTMQRKARVSGTRLDEYLTKQKRLELRMRDRQRRLQAAKDVFNVVKFINPVLAIFSEASIKRIYGVSDVNGIGVIPVAAYVVVAGVTLVAGVTWYAAYSHFKADSEASEIDLSEARNLAAVLEQVDPETKTRVLAEVKQYGQDQKDAGSAEAKTDEKNSPLAQASGIVKWGGIIFLASKFFG